MRNEDILLAARLVSNPYTPEQIVVMERAYDWYIASAGCHVPTVVPRADPQGRDVRYETWDTSYVNYMEHAMNHAVQAMRIKTELQRIGHWPTVEPAQPMTVEDFAKLFADAIQQFGQIPEGHERPGNAATLWKAMIHGWDRVSETLRAYKRR